MKKAVEIARFTGMTAVADDTRLEVEPWADGRGVFVARYAGSMPPTKTQCPEVVAGTQGIRLNGTTGPVHHRRRYRVCLAARPCRRRAS